MANIYGFTDVWNNGLTTYSAIKCSVTDTASAADSALIDMLVGGTSMFRVQKDGEISTQHNYSARQSWAQGTDLDDTDVNGSNILTLGTDGNYFQASGTQQIDGIASISGMGPILLVFSSVRTLTHNGTSFILPGAANITTAAGDSAIFVHEGSGNWRCVMYTISAAAYLSSLLEDTTPQLGGDLDLNGNGITFPGATVTDVTGADTLVVSGTAGTSGNLIMWNGDGDAVDSTVAAADLVVSGDFTTDGGVLVATGAGTYQEETGATLRTSLGLAIGSDVHAFMASASQAEMEAGTEAALRAMSPLRVAQAIAALGSVTAGAQSVQVFTASGTWTRPSGITKVLMFVTGGGSGSGDSTINDMPEGGGGAGGTAIKFLDVSSIASSTITVGAGGAVEASGGNSSWADGTNTVTGNGGGVADNETAGTGGSASGGDLNITGGDGQTTTQQGSNGSAGGTGGASFWGGGGRGGLGNTSGTGGNGRAGQAYGSGGGGGAPGSTADGSGAAGKAGVVFVLEFA